MNQHLHDRVAAFVDGELSGPARCRAVAHLQRCAACREAVEQERTTRSMMSRAACDGPSDDLVARLLAMGGPQGPLRPRDGHVPGEPRTDPLPAPGAPVRPRARSTRPAGRVEPRPSAPARTAPTGRGPVRGAVRRRRGIVALLGTVSLATVGVLGVGVVGGAVRVPSSAEPLLGNLVVERGGVVGQGPLVVPVARTTTPDRLPASVGGP